MTNRKLIPPPTLMEAFVDELAAKPSDDVAGDQRAGLLDGTTVVLSGYSVGIKYGGYNDREDQYDEAVAAPGSVSKGDRMRKVGKRAFARRGCISCKQGLRF